MTGASVQDIVGRLLYLAIGFVCVGSLVALAVWSVLMQRHGLARAQQVASRSDEVMALSRRSVEQQEKAFALLEQSLKNQTEIIRLLREIVDRQVANH